MSAKINSNYLENYAKEFSEKVCDPFFSTKKYMTGQDIVTLTPSVQVNFFIIKTLFEAWQKELEVLKSNPFFDYRDKMVQDVLKDFMNVLSRTIKIEKKHFIPLLEKSVQSSVYLAIDPLDFFRAEFEKQPEGKINQYLKENKKYIKWHLDLVLNLIDRAGLQHTKEAYIQALEKNCSKMSADLQDYKSLLNTMGQVVFLDFDTLVKEDEKGLIESKNKDAKEVSFFDTLEEENKLQDQAQPQELVYEEEDLSEEDLELVELPTEKLFRKSSQGSELDAHYFLSKFKQEAYSIMSVNVKDLTESVGLNQKFMFTKSLFAGNPDLLQHALKQMDECGSFHEAINLLNERYVGELGWNKDSEEVEEFLQLIFRKFEVG